MTRVAVRVAVPIGACTHKHQIPLKHEVYQLFVGRAMPHRQSLDVFEHVELGQSCPRQRAR